MRIKVRFDALLETPLAISSGRQSSSSETLSYIPGSTLRGGLLSAYRRVYGENEVFERLLEPGRNMFPFLYPCKEGSKSIGPIPLTWLACKRSRSEHSIGDMLLPRAKAKLMLGSSQDVLGRDGFDKGMKGLREVYSCPECGNDRKPLAGFRTGGKQAESPVLTRRVNVGIDRNTGTAARHILFGHEAVEPWVKEARENETSNGKNAAEWSRLLFSGVGSVHEKDIDAINEIIQGPVLLGKRRSRGYGRVHMKIMPAVDSGKKRKEEIENAGAALSRYFSSPGESYFTVDLVSPLIAFDSYLRCSVDPSDWLPRELDAVVVDCFLRRKTISGWDLGTGMPKDEGLASAEGSVILARSKKGMKELAAILAECENTGLGERVEEGFGRFLVNDPVRLKMTR